MSTIDHATVVDAEADRVWAVLRRFGDIDEWFPAVTSSVMEDDQPQHAVGAIRSMMLSDGNPLREKLFGLDDMNRTLSYGFEDSQLPYDDFVLTVTLVPLSTEPRTFVRWTARFDVKPDHDRDAGYKALHELIVGGDASLHQYFRENKDR